MPGMTPFVINNSEILKTLERLRGITKEESSFFGVRSFLSYPEDPFRLLYEQLWSLLQTMERELEFNIREFHKQSLLYIQWAETKGDKQGPYVPFGHGIATSNTQMENPFHTGDTWRKISMPEIDERETKP